MDLGPEATNRCKSCGMHIFNDGTILNAVDALVRRAESAEARCARWIRITEKMPPIGKVVETVSFSGVRKRAKWTGHYWERCNGRGSHTSYSVAFWLFEPEMPEPPVW